ncbi:MAG: hypothetical protein K2P81_10340 [Bacteriovoracaceae bacterium]|nr:hypothetical protein [Bacteriovoracaceae bacterium]
MMRCLILMALILSGNTFAKMAQNASADMVEARASLAPPPPTYSLSLSAVQTHLQNMQNLSSVAAILKVEKVTSPSQDLSHIPLTSIGQAIAAKIKESPKWEVTLSAPEVKAITPHIELLKTTFGEKSYSWAWFLKQTGKTAEAKQILMTIFDERCASVMLLTGTYNQQNPMIEVIEIEQALLPLLTAPEKAKVDIKMKDLKVHVSNLKDYSIMT